jgi:hypothetical protein
VNDAVVEVELRAKIKAYADQMARGERECTPAAVAATLRLILIGAHDPRYTP